MIKNNMKKAFNVLSPDGFSISMNEIYANEDIAIKKTKQWLTRFKKQGHYSSMNGNIHYLDIFDNCQITEVVIDDEMNQLINNEELILVG